jgi:hypothetical protein
MMGQEGIRTMNKEALQKKLKNVFVLTLIIAASLAGLIIIKNYVGFLGVEVPAEAGTITQIKIDDRRQTVLWAGGFGLVFRESGFVEDQFQTYAPGDITSTTLVFDCFEEKEEQEIYASLSNSIDFNNLRPGSTSMIDESFFNLSVGEFRTERANNTFVFNTSILVGATNISGIPAVYTYQNSLPNSTVFFTGILNDSGNLVMVGRAYYTTQTSFKSTNVRYQMLLPTPNSSTRWYFFPDPNDNCPAGGSTATIGSATIQGYVFEFNTTIPIQNAYVTAGVNSTFTNSLGFFNMSVPGDSVYDVIATKTGYEVNITQNVPTSIGNITDVNLTLKRPFGIESLNSTIFGYVRDNDTGEYVANVTILVKNFGGISNATGNYSINVTSGAHLIAAYKSGFENFIGNFTIANRQNLSYVINLTPFPTEGTPVNGSVINNGTLEGYVRDISTNALLSGVSVTLAGITNGTDALGHYNISAYAGSTNLVATRPGYNVYAAMVNITAFLTTQYNFSMTQTESTSQNNGSLYVLVRDSSGTPIPTAEVSVVGFSESTNSTGGAGFPSVPSGTHIVASTKTGYANFVGRVNISAGVSMYYNITMDTIEESGLGAGSGPGSGAGLGAGQGAGLGAGRGPGTGFTSQVEQPVEVREFEISVNRIIKKVRYGTFISVPLIIRNNLEEIKDVRITVEGDVRGMIQLDKERLLLEGASSQDLEVTVLGNREPGVYEGWLVFSGDIEERMPIYILVLEKERMAIETLLVKVSPEKEKYTLGSDLKFRVDLQNLLSDEKYKVLLSYTLESVKGNTSIFLEQEEVFVLTAFTILKKYEIPTDIPIGNYRIKVRAEFLDLNTESFAIFTIGQPIYKYALFGVIPVWMLLVLTAVGSTGTFGVLLYKKKQAAKKRYQLKVHYDMLPQPGPRTTYVGMIAETMNKTHLKLDQMQLHTLIAGSTGSGKSVAAQVVVEEALLKGVSVMVFDPTAQWTGFLRKSTDKRMFALYPRYGMKKTDAKAFNGNIKQILDARELIDIKKYMRPGEITSFTINKLDPQDADILVANTIRQVFKANLPESPELRLLIVFDEVHRLLPKFGGSGQGFLQIERALREFRKWGVGLVLISQVLKDFIGETKANINTQIQMRTSDEGDLGRITEDFGENLLQSLVKSPPGTGMIQNSENNKGEPYFVSFRALMHSTQRLTDKELDDYYKYNEIVDDIEYEMEQLGKEGVDLFDFQLELKMALDKVKAGSFNMVDIYIESLRPRLKAAWDKIGKQPQKRVKRLVSADELKEELEKAKKEQQKNQPAAQGGVPAPAPASEAAAQASIPSAPAAPASQEAPSSSSGTPSPIDEIEKARQAQRKAQQDAMQAVKTATQAPQTAKQEGMIAAISPHIKQLLDNAHDAITKGDKAQLKILYTTLQAEYKQATKEEKAEIFKEVQEIHKRLVS